MADSIVHFSGPRMNICGRIIQRCSVCGAKLCDSEGVMMPIGKEGEEPSYPTWEPGRLIEVAAGNPTRHLLLPDTDKKCQTTRVSSLPEISKHC